MNILSIFITSFVVGIILYLIVRYICLLYYLRCSIYCLEQKYKYLIKCSKNIEEANFLYNEFNFKLRNLDKVDYFKILFSFKKFSKFYNWKSND